MFTVLASSAIDRELELRSGKIKDYTIAGWLGIRIMYQSNATFLPVDCCFSDIAL